MYAIKCMIPVIELTFDDKMELPALKCYGIETGCDAGPDEADAYIRATMCQ